MTERPVQRQSSKGLQFVPPMLLRRVPSLPEGPQWQYEVKWDGYRMQAIKCGGRVRLLSRNGANYSNQFPEVADAIARLRPATLQLDGELVAIDRQGRPSFQVLQSRLPLPEGWRFALYAFDLLNVNGRDLWRFPLSDRRAHLKELVAGSGVRFSPNLECSAENVVRVVREQELEGVVAKRLDSLYEPGQRNGAWVKLPLKQRGRFLIGGYRPAGPNLCLLLVGCFRGGKFVFAGKVRQGLGKFTRAEVFHALAGLERRKCPFADIPNAKADPFDEMVTPEEMDSFVWLKPRALAEIGFREWTRFKVLRHAEFVSLG